MDKPAHLTGTHPRTDSAPDATADAITDVIGQAASPDSVSAFIARWQQGSCSDTVFS